MLAAGTLSSGFVGTWRSAITLPALVRAGDGGTWTLTFSEGTWTLRQTGGSLTNSVDHGTFEQQGSTLSLTLLSANGAPHHVFIGSVRVRESGRRLRFVPVPPERFDLLRVLAVGTWLKIH